MNCAWSVAARRSRSCEHAAIDTTSELGNDGGGDERRESGIMPDAGGAALGDLGRGVAEGGGMVFRLPPTEGGERNGNGLPPPEWGCKSGARLGGGTNARRAIVRKYYRKEAPASYLSSNFLAGASLDRRDGRPRRGANGCERVTDVPRASAGRAVLVSAVPMPTVSQLAPSQPAPPATALRDDGSLDEEHAAAISDELAVALYEQMVLARELDRRLIALQREGRVTQHASAIGEEAAIVGAAAAMRDEDWVFLASREVAAALWRGMPLLACAHHVFGTAVGAGRGRNMHAPPFWKPARVVSVSPLSGTQIPHAVGVAWAARRRGEDVAALVFFGDGATSSADFHSGLNFAGVTRAPVIALCRNNGWATSTPASLQTGSPGFAVKALAYGLRGVRVDGADVVAVLCAVRDARARASAGEGGTVIEAVTAEAVAVRSFTPDGGESADDPPRVDPIARMRRHLESRGLTDAERDQRLLSEVRADVERALGEAERGQPEAREGIFDDVYAGLPWHLTEQRDASASPVRVARV